MRVALTLLLAVHGTIHLLGYFKWWKGDAVSQLRGRTLFPLSERVERVFGLLWLAAFVLLLGAGALVVLAHEAWWIVALAAVVVSQCLVVVAWSDAKHATLANLLVLFPIVLAAAHARLERRIDAEARELVGPPAAEPPAPVGPAELSGLPSPVQRWLAASGVVGLPRARTVRLEQRGELRTSPEGEWMAVRAQQYFTVDEPGFLWKVETSQRGIPLAGRDRYYRGEGSMRVEAASIWPVVDASDDRISQAAMLRFLGEIVWFPSAALSPRIEWQAIEAGRAEATLRYAGKQVSAEFAIDERGRVTAIRADRWYGAGASATLLPWFVRCTEWREIRGVVVPVEGDAVWVLPGGTFPYYRWQILDVETNRAELYSKTAWPPRPLDRPLLAAVGTR